MQRSSVLSPTRKLIRGFWSFGPESPLFPLGAIGHNASCTEDHSDPFVRKHIFTKRNTSRFSESYWKSFVLTYHISILFGVLKSHRMTSSDGWAVVWQCLSAVTQGRLEIHRASCVDLCWLQETHPKQHTQEGCAPDICRCTSCSTLMTCLLSEDKSSFSHQRQASPFPNFWVMKSLGLFSQYEQWPRIQSHVHPFSTPNLLFP